MGKIINNYEMVKFKAIFHDGESEGIYFYFCGGKQITYICEIENNKASLFEKLCTGGSKRVDIPILKAAALKYFNECIDTTVTDYR